MTPDFSEGTKKISPKALCSRATADHAPPSFRPRIQRTKTPATMSKLITRPTQPTTMPYHPSQSSPPDNTLPSSLSPYFRGRQSLVAADMHWGSTNSTANPHIIIGDELNQGSSKKSISSIEMGSYTRRIARRGIRAITHATILNGNGQELI